MTLSERLRDDLALALRHRRALYGRGLLTVLPGPIFIESGTLLFFVIKRLWRGKPE